MDKAERAELLRKNAASRAALQRDMEERRQRRLDGEFDDEPKTPPATFNQGEQQVREQYERSRPTLDSATQALWNDWADARIKAIVNAKIEMLADIVGEESGRNEKRLREEIRCWRPGMRKDLHADLLKLFSKDFNSMRDDLLAVLRSDLGIKRDDDNVVDLPNPLSRKV
jgi:hypothetical protein